ncbi:hypothetical protein [Spirosoma endbachense]|uniref:Alpha/beta hydrolase n=1 Tax=Spirosoma endbachense TaxID=2666025 RepID=A0A6P1VRK4_9BACT|nr:hypothetical protein [Spirosoma endbachense]QHV95325.1 hypothetical protein GJR95_10010 [Spirosoma endbachense]
MKLFLISLFVLAITHGVNGQADSAAAYNDRAFTSYNQKNYAKSLYWMEKLFAMGFKDYQNNYNYYRAAISACQTNQIAKANAYFDELANKHLHYSMYYDFKQDSMLLACVSSTQAWKKAIAYTKPKYDSVQAANQRYYQGITDTTKRLNTSALLEEQRLAKLVGEGDFDQVYQRLKNYNAYDAPPVVGHWTLYQIKINDTLTVPFLIHIPKQYRPRQKTPLYVFLQGAVRGRPQFMTRGNVPSNEAPIFKHALEEGAFILYPFARKDIHWLYHPLAFQAILNEVAFLKSLYNIDDNRVWLSGHSNGGEGAFYFAINQPTTFASFLAFTYFPQSYMTNTPLRNLTNHRTFYGISAKNDHLFKLSKVDSIYQYAQSIGANWKNYALDGDHGLPINQANRVSFIYDTLFANVRNPFSPKIRWETDNVRNGRCDWIAITQLDTTARPAAWVSSYNPNMMAKDNRVKIDFNPHKTGVIEANIQNNIVSVKTSCIREFSFYVYPELVDTTKPISFIINGKATKPIPVTKNKSELAKAFIQTKDRVLLPVAKMVISVSR